MRQPTNEKGCTRHDHVGQNQDVYFTPSETLEDPMVEKGASVARFRNTMCHYIIKNLICFCVQVWTRTPTTPAGLIKILLHPTGAIGRSFWVFKCTETADVRASETRESDLSSLTIQSAIEILHMIFPSLQVQVAGFSKTNHLENHRSDPSSLPSLS